MTSRVLSLLLFWLLLMACGAAPAAPLSPRERVTDRRAELGQIVGQLAERARR